MQVFVIILACIRSGIWFLLCLTQIKVHRHWGVLVVERQCVCLCVCVCVKEKTLNIYYGSKYLWFHILWTVHRDILFKASWFRAPTSLTFNNCKLCPHCIYLFCIYMKTNSDLCHLQHKLIGFYNRDEKCLQRGTDWVFKYSGLRFVFKRLIFHWNYKVLHSAHIVFMCFVFIWEQTATCATYSINWLVFITEIKSVYSAVRTGSLNIAVCVSSLKD